MKIQENFESKLNSLLFSNQEHIFFERKKLLQKITSKTFDKKNNESLKNVDINKLLSFKYNYEIIDKKPTTNSNDNEYYQINIINGICQNFEDENIQVFNITNNESSIFFEQKFSSLNDLILDINSIFLNSGFILKIKKNCNVKIKIFNQPEKDTTIFQKNIIQCEQGSKVKILEEFNNSENSLNNILCSINVELDAKIEHTIIQDIKKSDNLYLTTYTNCEKNSLYNQHIFNFSDGFVRNFHYADLIGTESNAYLKGCFFIKDKKNGGLKVDKTCLSRAATYLEAARMKGRKYGEYSYQPGSSRTTHAMTAQGFFCQKMLSDTLDLQKGRKADEIRKFDDASMKYFMANLPEARDMNGVNFYYWYYATHALFQQGGEAWRVWNERLKDVLLESQVGREHGTAYGSWDPRGKRAEQAGRLYSTVLSILCLEVYYRYAPLGSGGGRGVRIEPRELEGAVNKPPPYPRKGGIARQEFDGQSVLLEIEVLANGRVGKVQIIDGCKGAGIDPRVAGRVEKSVVAAVRKWRWHPGKLDGAAVTTLIRHRIKFVLPNR